MQATQALRCLEGRFQGGQDLSCSRKQRLIPGLGEAPWQAKLARDGCTREADEHEEEDVEGGEGGGRGSEVQVLRSSPEKEHARMDELEERARLFGDSAKQSAQAKVLERKWLRFVLVHGKANNFDGKSSPSVELVKRFTTYCFSTRDKVSAIGREGLGDGYELQIRYMLAKFVFVALKYKGWVGLSEHELHEKATPYKFAVREHWKRLKRSDKDLMSTLKPFVKAKWCDTAYFLSQVS